MDDSPASAGAREPCYGLPEAAAIKACHPAPLTAITSSLTKTPKLLSIPTYVVGVAKCLCTWVQV